MLSSPLYRAGQAAEARGEPLAAGGDTASRLQAQALAALAKLRQKQADQARERADVVRALRTAAAQAAKAAARERLEMIKKRIKELLHLLAMFGGSSARGTLQELRQLSSQLREAAAVLRAGDGAPAAEEGGAAAAPAAAPSAPAAVPASTGDDHAEGRAAYADQQQAAEAESGDPLKHHHNPQDTERESDERLIDAVQKLLRSVTAMAESEAKKQAA